MQIKEIELKDFRNYKKLKLKFDSSINIIYGNNGQGKTNILEAVFICASGRSHRTSRDNELIRYNAESYEIKLLYERGSLEEEIRISYSNNEKKRIKIDEIPLKRIGDLMGHLNAIIFSPEDLMLIKQGPAERRRFADIAISQLKPSYFYDLQQYARILFQRNVLLKKIAVQKSLENTLDIWNRHLVNTGTRIIMERMKFIEKLSILAGLRHQKLTNNREELRLSYVPSFEIKHGYNEKDIEGKYYEALEQNSIKEMKKGITIFGPHRDDIDIVLNGESTKIYGSQGQQRTSVLSMKLAEMDLMKEESGEYPVLLLDDVLSELDDMRKEYLLDNIDGLQAFITCTDKRFFKRDCPSRAIFYVEAGTVLNS